MCKHESSGQARAETPPHRAADWADNTAKEKKKQFIVLALSYDIYITEIFFCTSKFLWWHPAAISGL